MKKNLKAKSLKRKSLRRKSLKRKSLKRKSLKNKSMRRRKSIKRKSYSPEIIIGSALLGLGGLGLAGLYYKQNKFEKDFQKKQHSRYLQQDLTNEIKFKKLGENINKKRTSDMENIFGSIQLLRDEK